MKQMLTSAGGVFFAVGLIFLIFGGLSFHDKIQFQNQLESRPEWQKKVSKGIGWDDVKQKELQQKHDLMMVFLIIGGVSSSLGVGLALVGRTKPTS